MLDDLPDIRRKQKIEQDFLELWKNDTPPMITNSTQHYIRHMKDIITDRNAIMAHVYVLHMGDLSGGQMIARKAPGEGRMYQFDTDKKQLKESIRAKINDDMAEEAKYCFTASTNLFKELMELDIEPYLEQTN